MITGEKDDVTIRQAALGAVRKPRQRLRQPLPGFAPRGQERPKSDLSQGNDGAHVFEQLQFLSQKKPAGADLLRRWFIVRWCAAHGGGYNAVMQFQPVARVTRLRPVAESEPVKGFVQPVPAAVACEHATGSIAAVRSRREPDDDQAGAGQPERRKRPPPVTLMLKTAYFLSRDALPPLDKPRAPAAIHDRCLQFSEQSLCGPQVYSTSPHTPSGV
jgi:hypothetical protein